MIRTQASILSPNDDDDYYHHLLSQARECALTDDDDDTATLQCDPSDYLWQILELESACMSGNLLGEEDDLCAIDPVAEIVTRLRERAVRQAATM